MSVEQQGDTALLELVSEVMGLLELSDFREGVLHAIKSGVPSEWASLNEMGADGVVAAVATPVLDEIWLERFGRLGHQNPLYEHHLRTRDGRAYRFSDVVSRHELEATELYQQFYEPLGIRHQIAFTLTSTTGRVIAIALSRSGRDYSDAERDFLNRARPFLIQAYRNALAYSERDGRSADHIVPTLVAAGLTQRQAEVVRLVALGRSNRDVAESLALSERTVDKHLELAFRRLGVATRSAAAARAWELAQDGAARLWEDPD